MPKNTSSSDYKLPDEVVYLNDDFEIVPKEKATIVKVVKNGKVTFGIPKRLVKEEKPEES